MSCLDLALVLGEKVDRVSATLPQTSTQALFTISGGRVVVTSFYGKVTTATGGYSGSPTLRVQSNPTVGITRDFIVEGMDNLPAGYC